MADDPEKTRLDRKLIALEEPGKIRSWTQSLDCSEADLRRAIAAVGHSAETVREHLSKGK